MDVFCFNFFKRGVSCTQILPHESPLPHPSALAKLLQYVGAGQGGKETPPRLTHKAVCVCLARAASLDI